MRTTPRILIAVTAACLLMFAGCGSANEEVAAPVDTIEPEDSPATTDDAGASSSMQACEDQTPPLPPKQEDEGNKPHVEVPEGAPPCRLVSQDIKAGSGAEAQAGDTVTVQYVGVSWSTGEQFDSSWDRGQPATFPLSGVIEGWQEGIPGMKEGGRRRLIIPPDLAYGETPPDGSGIAVGETLVFVIDLLEVG